MEDEFALVTLSLSPRNYIESMAHLPFYMIALEGRASAPKLFIHRMLHSLANVQPCFPNCQQTRIAMTPHVTLRLPSSHISPCAVCACTTNSSNINRAEVFMNFNRTNSPRAGPPAHQKFEESIKWSCDSGE